VAGTSPGSGTISSAPLTRIFLSGVTKVLVEGTENDDQVRVGPSRSWVHEQSCKRRLSGDLEQVTL
jgi:hypothetical protein